MKRINFFRCVINCYLALVTLLWIYLIASSLFFSYEHFIGNPPAGIQWFFVVIGSIFAWQMLKRKMQRTEYLAGQLFLLSNKDLLAYALIFGAGLTISFFLVWGWLKLYPTF